MNFGLVLLAVVTGNRVHFRKVSDQLLIDTGLKQTAVLSGRLSEVSRALPAKQNTAGCNWFFSGPKPAIGLGAPEKNVDSPGFSSLDVIAITLSPLIKPKSQEC